MNPIQQFQEICLRVFYRPFQIKKQTDFHDSIKNAKNILVYCPDENAASGYKSHLKKIFSQSAIHMIMPVTDAAGANLQLSGTECYYVIPNSIRKTKNLPHYKTMTNLHYDLFMDLDPKPNLVNMFLCRLLEPGVCMAYAKPLIQHYYNFQLRAGSELAASEKMNKLCNILSSFRKS
jgi:hypothetical protein